MATPIRVPADAIKKTGGEFKKILQEAVNAHTFAFFESPAAPPTTDAKMLEIKVRLEDLRALDKLPLSWAEMTTWKSKKVIEVFAVSRASNGGYDYAGATDKQGNPLVVKNGDRLNGFNHAYLDTPNKTTGVRKEKRMPGWRVRFIETKKTETAPSGASTHVQEIGSAYIFTQTLIKKNNHYNNWQELKTEINKENGIFKHLKYGKKYFPNITDDWIENYYKQYKKILAVFSSPNMTIPTKFDHSKDFFASRSSEDNFMGWIEKQLLDNFGVTKKDNWNPADIWAVSKPVSTIKNRIERSVFGSRDSQTIEQLNATLRGMWHHGDLYGISLKKVSGPKNAPADWEVYNLDKMTLAEKSNYMYDLIEVTCQLKEGMSTDSIVHCDDSSNKGYKFQIRPNSRGLSNLKFESTKKGSTKARGGKAAVDQVVALLKENNKRSTFINDWSQYPQSAAELEGTVKGTGNCCFTKDTWKKMIDELIGDRSVTTEVSKSIDAINNIKNFYNVSQPEAISKLMQITFLVNALRIKKNPPRLGADGDEQYTEFWTDMVFLSIKKGDKFGPFGKLF